MCRRRYNVHTEAPGQIWYTLLFNIATVFATIVPIVAANSHDDKTFRSRDIAITAMRARVWTRLLSILRPLMHTHRLADEIFLSVKRVHCDKNDRKLCPHFSERQLYRLSVAYLSPVCRLSVVRLSSVCRLSATFVHPAQAIEIFGNVSTPFGTMATCWQPGKILQRSSQGNPSTRG